MIKVYLKGQQTDWDLFLGCLAGAYRSSTHQSTGFTPNMLMLGKEIRLPTEIVFWEPRQYRRDYFILRKLRGIYTGKNAQSTRNCPEAVS